MITKENIQQILLSEQFGFVEETGLFYSRHYGTDAEDFTLSYNMATGDFVYPQEVEADRNTTKDSHQKESFVCFLCVAQLFAIGYKPNQIKLEGKNYSGTDKGFCDILVKYNDGKEYLIIECKTADLANKDDEFRKHWAKTLRNGDQLFRYFNTYRRASYLCLFSSDYLQYKDNNNENKYRFENIYHVISLEDNPEQLKTNSKFKSFDELRKEQGTSDEFFNVWRKTYMQDYNTRGLLEPGIEPFKIGKKKYDITDLRAVDSYSLGKKYGEFALILRKHTVSSHENAFDKLINLFIAKIIDEKYNHKELQLLWKGAAYDDYFSLQDRLNILYRRGMKEFFDDEVTYVKDEEIDGAFAFLTSKADAAKSAIKDYFRQLKYFNNNPFAFLDVHNEPLFYQNAAILKDVITMLQDIHLTANEDHQFLGDLFEGFLNKGVHQSEGQFFSPIPIVRFLVSSLPLQSLIENGAELPRVVDYACGSGHFLTEYARQIRPFVLSSMQDELSNVPSGDEQKTIIKNKLLSYYQQIIGIEKDYRLSKVSQVAAFMYNMDGMHVHFADALTDIEGVKDGTFDVLVANPPYSVSGFLETLDEDQRSKFELTSQVSNPSKNNAIETFFIERAAQLLSPNGVATIILPSSFLTKGSVYIRTRELLLKNFDIVSICSFGKNTFGQTNTTTVALFLRRKAYKPNAAEHIQNRVDAWFEGNMQDDDYYNETEALNAYVKRCGFDLNDYTSMMCGSLTDKILAYDIVKDYVKSLNIHKQRKNDDSSTLANAAKEIRIEAQRVVSGRKFKDFTPSKQNEIIEDYTLRFIQAIEKEKLYFYLLAYNNPQPVLVMNAPDGDTKKDKADAKEFLGYEWSERKGSEGIQYLNVSTKGAKGNDDEAVDDTIDQVKGIDGIITPMFNPLNLNNDEEKINYYIRQNYQGESFDLPDSLSKHINLYSLTDLMDFSAVGFDKSIKTVPILSFPQIESKYPTKKLKEIAPFVKDKERFDNEKITSYISTSNMIENRGGVESYDGVPNVDKVTAYKKGDILISNIRPYLKKVWMATHDGGCSNDVLVFRNQKSSVILNEYLYYLLSCDLFFDYMMVGKTGVKMPRGDKKMIPNFEIPIPPKSVQKKIAEECAEVDKQQEHSTNIVSKTRREICSLANKFFETSHYASLGSLCDEPMYGANTPAKDGDRVNDFRYIRVTDVDDDGNLNNDWKTATEVEGKYILIEGDMLFARSGATAGKTFMYRSDVGKALYAGYLIKFHPNEDKLLPEFLDLLTRSDNYKSWSVQTRGGTAQPNINAQQFASFMIPVVDLDKQKEAVRQYRNLRTNLFRALKDIDSASSRKQSILYIYLK